VSRDSPRLSGKKFHEDGAATANACTVSLASVYVF